MNYTKSMNNNNKNMNSTNNKYYGFGDWLREDPKTKFGGFMKDVGMAYGNYSGQIGSLFTGKPYEAKYKAEDFNTDLGVIGGKAADKYGAFTAKAAPSLLSMAVGTNFGMGKGGQGDGQEQYGGDVNTPIGGYDAYSRQMDDTMMAAYGGYLNNRLPMSSFAFGGDYMNNKGNAPKKENNFTYYNAGGTHESNPYGGIPIGKQSFVEQGEFKFRHPVTREEYIFTNRF